MTDSPKWTPPDISALLADFNPPTPNLDLIDTYLAAGNVAALRSIFQMLSEAKNRAEHLSRAYLVYIHAQLTQEPRVKEYFDQQMRERDIELKSAGLRARKSSAEPSTKTPTPRTAAATRASKPTAAPVGAQDW